jgi:hypothetical protein
VTRIDSDVAASLSASESKIQAQFVDLTKSNVNLPVTVQPESVTQIDSARDVAASLSASESKVQAQFVDLSNGDDFDFNQESADKTASNISGTSSDFIVHVNRAFILILAVGESESDALAARANYWATQELTEDQLSYLQVDSSVLELGLDPNAETVIITASSKNTSRYSHDARRYFHVSGDFKTFRGVEAIYSEIVERFGRLPDIVILDYFWLQAGWFDFGHYGDNWVNHAIYALTEVKSINKVKAFIVPVDKRGDMIRLVTKDKAKLDANCLEAIPLTVANASDNLFLIQWDEGFHAEDPSG